MGKQPILTWQERCERHPAHRGIVTTAMVQSRMQEEIDDLRARVAELEAAIRDMRTAALVEDWHTFDATVTNVMREGKND